jgi:hypothetical protein
MASLITLISFGLLGFLIWEAFIKKDENKGKEVWIYKKFGPMKAISDGPKMFVNTDESERAWVDWKKYGIDVPDYIPPDKKSREERFAHMSDQQIAALQAHAKKEAEFAKERV